MPIDINGLLTTLDDRAIDRANLLVLYNFAESGTLVNKAPNYSGNFSGFVNGPNLFYGSGTGFPTQNYVSISGTGFSSSSFSHLFLVQKSGQGNDNYFSSIATESGVTSSGYLISSNDVGNLIFSYKDCSGPKSVTSDFTLNNLSHFAVVKNDNLVSFYQYTPVINRTDGTSFTVTATEIFPSDYADLFFANRAPAGFLKDYYSGFVNNYLYFNIPLSPNQITDVFSGLYNVITTSPTTPSGLDASGFFIFPSGGDISISGSPDISSALTRNVIVLLRPLPSGSSVLVDYDISDNSTTWNKTAKFDASKSNFITDISTSLPPILYLNGQRIVSGTANVTGSFCSTGKYYQYDYSLAFQRQVDGAGNLGEFDDVVYDIPSRHIWQQVSSGSGSVIISTGSGIAVYLNGQRTLNYSTSGTTLLFGQSVASGDRTVIDYYETGKSVLGEVVQTGFFATSGYFIPDSSRVYLNGIRLILNQDYLESVTGSLLQGVPQEQPITDVVNIDNYNFWNI